MAILYGTTADGDSLPVEVNEFGQLIAQGLQGQPGAEGPPGPPGIGQLPPDPFEGAILGWKDNTLSWLGGAVPLPVGTYGPITAYQGGVLTLASTIDLPYLAKFFLSDKLGNEFVWTPSTSLISNVNVAGGNVLTLTDDMNISNFRVGDVVQSSWNQSRIWSDDWTPDATPYSGPSNIFDGDDSTYYAVNYTGSTLTPSTAIISPPITGSVIKMLYQKDTNAVGTVNGTEELPVTGAATYAWTTLAATELNSVTLTHSTSGSCYLRAIEVDGLQLVDTGISNPSAISITSISTGPPSITTNGGKWLGTDGTGVPDGERTVVGPEIIGQGSVQSTTGNNIILREDNGGWKVGEYITTTNQAIAARYVAAQRRRSQNTELLYKEQ
jgi:hypothetical protein